MAYTHPSQRHVYTHQQKISKYRVSKDPAILLLNMSKRKENIGLHNVCNSQKGRNNPNAYHVSSDKWINKKYTYTQ